MTRAELEWNPVVFYCHHQTAPFPTRIFIPPFTEPISSNIHPLMGRWLNAFGINMAAYLDEHQMPGAVHRVGFNNWYPGFLDFTHIFRNSIAFFTETALYRYATPHFYTVDEFPKDRQVQWSENERAMKLTTLSMRKLVSGELNFRELRRRRSEV